MCRWCEDWWEEVKRHGDDWFRTSLYVGFWWFAGIYALVRLFVAWDWDNLPDLLLTSLAFNTILMLLASFSRFWWIVPCHTPKRVKISFALHMLAFANTVWAWICFTETGLPVFDAENESAIVPTSSITALYYIRTLLALITVTHIGNLLVCTCHALCTFCDQAPPASASSFTLAPLATPFFLPTYQSPTIAATATPITSMGRRRSESKVSPLTKSSPFTDSPDSAAYIVNSTNDEPLLQVSTDLSEPSSL
jgi:hypothetical protein